MSLNAKTKVTNSREEAIDFAMDLASSLITDLKVQKKKHPKGMFDAELIFLPAFQFLFPDFVFLLPAKISIQQIINAHFLNVMTENPKRKYLCPY